MRENLFFDLDGTLTDSRPGIVHCLRHALEQLDVPAPAEDELSRYIGPPLHESLSHLLGPDRAHLVPRALELYRARFGTVGMFENRIYEGASMALEALAAAGFRLWVVTSKPTVYAVPIVEHFGVRAHFAAVHGSELSGERSRKGELIAHVLRAEGIPATRAVMIGDRSHDMAGARENDVRALGVLWGYGSRVELTGAGAAGLFETFPELVSALTHFDGRRVKAR